MNDTHLPVWVFSGHNYEVRSVAFSPCGGYIASGSCDTTIKLWDVSTKECIHTFEGHKDFINSIAFSPCGKYIASSSDDNTIKLWKTPHE